MMSVHFFSDYITIMAVTDVHQITWFYYRPNKKIPSIGRPRNNIQTNPDGVILSSTLLCIDGCIVYTYNIKDPESCSCCRPFLVFRNKNGGLPSMPLFPIKQWL